MIQQGFTELNQIKMKLKTPSFSILGNTGLPIKSDQNEIEK